MGTSFFLISYFSRNKKNCCHQTIEFNAKNVNGDMTFVTLYNIWSIIMSKCLVHVLFDCETLLGRYTTKKGKNTKYDSNRKSRRIKLFGSKFLAYCFVYHFCNYFFCRDVIKCNNNKSLKERVCSYLVRKCKWI